MSKVNRKSGVEQVNDGAAGLGERTRPVEARGVVQATSRPTSRKRPSPDRPEAGTRNWNKRSSMPVTKADMVLKRLNGAKDVTLASLMDATGWQAHSVRGFLSGTVRKKLGHNLICETGRDGQRRYRIDTTVPAGE